MEWQQFLRGEMGWAAAAAMVLEFFRRLLKGDIVLKREYDTALSTASKAVEKADALVDEANNQALETIKAQAAANAAQAKIIEVYEHRQGAGQ
jgi:hypothetical protein